MTVDYSATNTSSDGQSTTSGDGRSTAQAAREVGGHAGQAGRDVAHTAKEQGRETLAEARQQAQDLLGQARGQLRGQAAEQQRRAADGLRSLAEEMRSMADRGEKPGPVSDLARQGADRINGVAGWLEQREPGDLLDQVRGYARRSPGTFLLGAALLGVAAGRLTRGTTDSGGGGGQSAPAGPPGVAGTPAAATPRGRAPVTPPAPTGSSAATPAPPTGGARS